jgi:hypothetical protein
MAAEKKQGRETDEARELLTMIRRYTNKEVLAEILQEELERLNLNKENNFNLAVGKVLQQIENCCHVVKFVSFGVGAAGTGTRSSLLTTPNDLMIFREYSNKTNYYLGSDNHEGEVAGSKESIIIAIKRSFSFALALQRDFVLYYTGHGSGRRRAGADDDFQGNWCFSDGNLSFFELVELLDSVRQNAISSNVVYVICDCCYSGQWVERWKSLDDLHRASIRVIASCSKDQTCSDGVFSRVFFAAAPDLCASKVDEMTGNAVYQEILKRVFQNVGHGEERTIGNQSYNKSKLGKKTAEQKREILKFLIESESTIAVDQFLRVGPRYCDHQFTEDEAKKIMKKGFCKMMMDSSK